jgi:hypothetical protein
MKIHSIEGHSCLESQVRGLNYRTIYCIGSKYKLLFFLTEKIEYIIINKVVDLAQNAPKKPLKFTTNPSKKNIS